MNNNDDYKNLDLQNNSTLENLFRYSEMLVPWWSMHNEIHPLKLQTGESPQNYLDSFYLSPLNEISLNFDCKDTEQFINERFQVILSAANNSGITVMLLISNRNGNNKIYIGFRKDTNSFSNNLLFESIINGVLPGKRIKLNEQVKVSTLTEGFIHGGMVTGVPTIKNDDE